MKVAMVIIAYKEEKTKD